MSKEHITLRIDQAFYGRVKAAANRSRMTVSEYVRGVLEEKLDKDHLNPELLLTRGELEEKIMPIVEELMIVVYGLEEMIVSGFWDSKVTMSSDNESKIEFLKSVCAISKEKATKLLAGGGEAPCMPK